jgi:hypothetical protein
MFTKAQELKLFSRHKSPNLRQFLVWLVYRPPATMELFTATAFDAVLPGNLGFGRLSAQSKSSNSDAFINISRLIAQSLGYLSLDKE